MQQEEKWGGERKEKDRNGWCVGVIPHYLPSFLKEEMPPSVLQTRGNLFPEAPRAVIEMTWGG